MIRVPLLLAVTPVTPVTPETPVLEPDAAGAPRLQPREVRTTDSAANALWAVDDDPATAWTASPKSATLTWRGGTNVSKTFTLFVRAGCQSTKELFAAYARPHHLEISTGRPVYGRSRIHMMQPPPMIMRLDENGVVSKPLEVELKDLAGWQTIQVPAVSDTGPLSFTIKVTDTYAGKSHDEVCISDVRVHAAGIEGAYVASEEQLAFNGIKRAIAEQSKKTVVTQRRLPAGFDQQDLDDEATAAPAPKTELALHAPNPLQASLKRARSAVVEMRAAFSIPVSKLEENGWKRASISAVLENDTTLEDALESRESATRMGDTLLASDDFKLTAAANPTVGLKAKLRELARLAEKPLECQAACLPLYAGTSYSTQSVRADCTRACSMGDEGSADIRLDIAGSGVFVKGGLDSPRELLIVSSREGGEREVYRRQERELFVYENGRVNTVASANTWPRYAQAKVLTWSDDRSMVQSMLEVSFDGGKIEGMTRMTAKPEHASLDPDPDGPSFDLQR